MKIRTHINIARLSLMKMEEVSPDNKIKFFKKFMFYLGTITPDFSIEQFIHPHFYEKSSEYIFKKIVKLEKKKKISYLSAYQLGKGVHYFSDFCCYAHITGGVGKITEHMEYERQINTYLLRNYKNISRQTFSIRNRLNSSMDVVSKIKLVISQYKIEKPCFHLDILKSMEITTILYQHLFVRYAI